MFEAHEMVLLDSIRHSIFAGPSAVSAKRTAGVAALRSPAAEAPFVGMQQSGCIPIMPPLERESTGLRLVQEANAVHE